MQSQLREGSVLENVRVLYFPVLVDCWLSVYAMVNELDPTASNPCPAMLWPPLRVRFLYRTLCFNNKNERVTSEYPPPDLASVREAQPTQLSRSM